MKRKLSESIGSAKTMISLLNVSKELWTGLSELMLSQEIVNLSFKLKLSKNLYSSLGKCFLMLLKFEGRLTFLIFQLQFLSQLK